MLGVELVAQHRHGEPAVRRECIQPRNDCRAQALARAGFGPAGRLRDRQHRGVGAVEPGLGNGVLVLEVASHLGQAQARQTRHLMQMHGVPATLLAERERRIENRVAPVVEGDRRDADQSHRNSR